MFQSLHSTCSRSSPILETRKKNYFYEKIKTKTIQNNMYYFSKLDLRRDSVDSFSWFLLIRISSSAYFFSRSSNKSTSSYQFNKCIKILFLFFFLINKGKQILFTYLCHINQKTRSLRSACSSCTFCFWHKNRARWNRRWHWKVAVWSANRSIQRQAGSAETSISGPCFLARVEMSSCINFCVINLYR